MVIPVSSIGSTGGLYRAHLQGNRQLLTQVDLATFGWLSTSHKFYNEVKGILKGAGRESVMPQWIIVQIYGTWFLQVCSHGLVGEVGALITINLRIVHSNFHAQYLTGYDSSSKQKKVVMLRSDL